MHRQIVSPRENWPQIVESQGFHFHSADDKPYWDESACYVLSSDEVEALETATYALNDMCLEAVQFVFDHDLLETFSVPPMYHDWLRASWEKDEDTLYGRFDLALLQDGRIKMLEYNADTPTALLEASVIQWFWLKQTGIGTDQFNSIHEKLIDAWKTFRPRLTEPVFFTSLRDHLEDFMTVNYLRDTAMQAGLNCDYLAMEDIAWNAGRRQFVNKQEQPLGTLFKLYPWEWMFNEEFGPNILQSETRWLEPAWKVLMSNKAILPVLWHLYPDHPNLLRAEYKPFGSTYLQKPMQGREGANITLIMDGQTRWQTEGPYEGSSVYQEWCSLPNYQGSYPVIGSWMINGYASGIGIREDIHPVTQNTSRFIPHHIQ